MAASRWSGGGRALLVGAVAGGVWEWGGGGLGELQLQLERGEEGCVVATAAW